LIFQGSHLLIFDKVFYLGLSKWQVRQSQVQSMHPVSGMAAHCIRLQSVKQAKYFSAIFLFP
jgi:hypothetical protein